MTFRIIRGAVATAIASLLFASAPALAQDYRLLHSWDRSTDPTVAYLLDNFIPSVQKAIPSMKIRTFGPEAVPPFEQMEPARSGVFQFLYTHTAYHFGTTRGAFGADAIDGNGATRRKAGVWDEIDRHYNTLGLKLIAMTTCAEGFHFQTTKPLVDGTFKGLTVRGTQVYHSLINYLGGAPVVMPIGEVYTALDRGVVQGAASPLLGSASLNWNSKAKYLVRPRIGTSTTYIFMNMASFKALPAEAQGALLKVGEEFETAADAHFVKLLADEEKALIAAGSQIAPIAPDKAAELKKVWADGLFTLAAQTNAEASNRLREVARKAGLTP